MEKIERIVGSYQRKAAKKGGDWLDIMYGDFTAQGGVDPREFWHNEYARKRKRVKPRFAEAPEEIEAAPVHAAVLAPGDVFDEIESAERVRQRDINSDRAHYYAARRKLADEKQREEREYISQRYAAESAARKKEQQAKVSAPRQCSSRFA
eukprot:SAG11_NODE_1891_length_4106_cov_7.347891_2_plen_151_part_00